MKKLILLLIISAKSFAAVAEVTETPCMLTNKQVKSNCTNKNFKNLSLKNWFTSSKEFKKTSTERIVPKFSMGLTTKDGIHLFNTPEVGPIPSLEIGTKIKAGIKIIL